MLCINLRAHYASILGGVLSVLALYFGGAASSVIGKLRKAYMAVLTVEKRYNADHFVSVDLSRQFRERI